MDLKRFSKWCGTHAVIQNSETKEWIVVESDEPVLLRQVNDQIVHLFLEYCRAIAIPKKPGATQISEHTVASIALVLKAFLNWCVCDPEYSNQIHFETIQRIEVPSYEQGIIQPFSDEQITALFAACDKEGDEHLQLRARTILAVLLDTGIRAEELCTLKIGDVSLDVKDAYIRVFGKGQKWGEVGLGEQSRRLLQKYLRMFRIPTLEYALQKKYQHLPPKQLKMVVDQAIAGEPAFMSRIAKPLTVSGLEQLFKRLEVVAHIEGVRCSPHTMRHSFAVRFWRRTHDIRTLSKLLRHANIRITEEYLKSILQSEARLGAPSMFDELSGHYTLTINASSVSEKKVRTNVRKRRG